MIAIGHSPIDDVVRLGVFESPLFEQLLDPSWLSCDKAPVISLYPS